MTYVVAEPCVNCRYTDCALVCPVEAFHLDDDMLHINPRPALTAMRVPECRLRLCCFEKPTFRPSGHTLRR